ncbi:hypothetical protein PRK78_000744 [Emydomyces testavorans]|uniref:Ferric oxidoreductase domain-containing protein n=1 Tax=Emydomyces testavorans TaxID=2070801 RepID=A0AAF0IER7_9EURO|nr:hypothetical protein PRK78_000744 [Emydomyces testavorans]
MGQIPLQPYRFLSLAPSQIQARRELLDLRGTIAQASGVIVLLCVGLYRRRTVARGSAAEEVSRGKSWLDAPPVKGWRETRREYLLTLVWAVWLVGLSAWRTGDDYIHLTRSLAHTAIATIPLSILISPGPPGLPTRTHVLLRLLGIRQSMLTPYHRLYGRFVLLPLFTLHAILYMAFFIRQSLLSKRIYDTDLQLGMLAVGLVLNVWSMSSEARGLTRWRFYIGHVVAVMALLAVAYFHVVYVRTYVLECMGIYALDMSWYVVRRYWSGSKKD